MKYVKPLELYHEFLKFNSGRLLGVSVRKSIHLALSDTEKTTAIPISDLCKTTKKGVGVAELKNLQNLIWYQNTHSDFSFTFVDGYLQSLERPSATWHGIPWLSFHSLNHHAGVKDNVSKHSVSGLVISYPFERESGLPTAGVQTKRFVDDLTKSGKFEGINYTFWDETLKSMAVERMSEEFEIDGAALLGVLDRASAWEILQGYLNFFHKNHDQTTFEGEHGHSRCGEPKPT